MTRSAASALAAAARIVANAIAAYRACAPMRFSLCSWQPRCEPLPPKTLSSRAAGQLIAAEQAEIDDFTNAQPIAKPAARKWINERQTQGLLRRLFRATSVLWGSIRGTPNGNPERAGRRHLCGDRHWSP